MKLLLTLLKITTLFVFVGITAFTIGAYLNLPLPLKPLVVKSGSMEPTIKTGSLVLVTEQGKSTSRINYVNGDIITFKVKNELVSHRIVEIQKKDAFRYFVTKGDANKTPDTSLVAEKDVVGKASLTIPYIGRFVDFVKTPLGFFLLIIIPTLLIIISELFAVWEELRKKQSSSGGNLDFAKPLAMIFIAAIFLTGTHAFFSSVATSTNNTFTAANFFVPKVVINEVNWPGNNDHTNDEWIELFNTTSVPIDISGWRLKRFNGTSEVDMLTVPALSTIPANGFFLISNLINTSSSTVVNVVPDLVDASVLLDNTDLQVKLYDNLTNLIDVAWDKTNPTVGRNSPLPKASMERNSLITNGLLYTSWHTATHSANLKPGAAESATPKAANGP